MKKGLFILLLLALSRALPAHADEDAELRELLSLSLEKLMSITVSISTNTKQTLSKAPSVVSVITADDIRATGTTNLMEILQSVPGIYIRHNQFGFRPLISFRGSPAGQVLLMVNGAPLRDLVWTAGIFWKGLPAGMIERVEIIRGPGSALFGSDAAAGVVNVITKTAGRIEQNEAGIRLGSFDTQTAWLQHGTTWNGFEVGLTAEASHTDGHRPHIAADRQSKGGLLSYAPDQAEFGYDNLDLRFSMARDNWRLLADHMQKTDVGIGLTGASILDPATRASDSQSSLALLYGNAEFAPDWGLDAEVRYRDLEYSSGNGFWEKPASVPDLNRMRSAERRFNAEASGLYRGFANHVLRLGGGYVWQDLYFVEQFINRVPAVFVPEKDRINRYAFIQDVWSFAQDWELTAGARYDRYDGFAAVLNPRLALVWQTTDRLTSKLMFGKAFRVPSYLELYALTSATLSDPNLTPEKTATWDLAFSYRATRNLALGVNLFQFVQKDPIVDVAGQFINGETHTIRGIEMEAQWQATRTLRLAGNYTKRHQDACPNALFYSVPDEEAYLRADWAFLPKWNWNLQANWTGKRTLPASDTRKPLGGHTLADTTVRYFHGSEWEFAASIRNLFDADAREYTGSSIPNYLPLPRRSFFAELRYKF